MYLKRFFDRLTISLSVMVLLYTGIQVAKGQDSAKIWKDSKTGLLWTVEDNGNDLSWNQANNYCESLTLGGHTDWRLPTIDELEGLYDGKLSKQYKASGPIDLTGASVWSGTRNATGDAWSFNFGFGGKSVAPTGGACGTVGRALCTCGSGSK
jgi:formylglycine-generating enzyme required for sulfatase activity